MLGLLGDIHDPGCQRRIVIPDSWQVKAEFSEDGRYRFLLEHRWQETGDLVGFLLMNPSGADQCFLDATTLKTAKMARRWGYAGQIIVNVSPYRRTDSTKLSEHEVPAEMRSRNFRAVLTAMERAKLCIVAHGALPTQQMRQDAAYLDNELTKRYNAHVLGVSMTGIPLHPMSRGKRHVSVFAEPQVWRR